MLHSRHQGLISDQIDLQTKIDHLAKFMMGETYLGLSQREKDLLATQLLLMRQYSDVLIERMKAFS
jgi:hypothetical protein